MADENFVSALETGDLGAVTYFVESRGGLATLEGGTDPLQLAAGGGHAAVVEYLLERCGDEVMDVMCRGTAPWAVLAAVRNNNRDIVDMILRQGGQVSL